MISNPKAQQPGAAQSGEGPRGHTALSSALLEPEVAPAKPLSLVSAPPESDSMGQRSTREMSSRLPLGDRMIAFAEDHFDVFRSRTGLVFGVRKGEGGRAYAHPGALMGEVKTLFRALHGRWPDSKASALCSDYLSTQAVQSTSREVALRSSWSPSLRRLLIDTGDADWRVMQVTATGWRYVPTSPVPFRRSEITAALPEPGEEAELEALWRLVNVSEADRPLVLALLLCAWLTRVSQPIVFLTGPQDAGKTEAARFLLRLVDPVTISERGGSLPSREEEWKSRVSAYRCVLIDNASTITAAQSDMLCKVATGGEATTRTLYTNDTAHVSDMQVPVWLTSIGVGVLRNDLQSRMVRVELDALDSGRRTALSDLRAAQDEASPRVMRALLDLAVDVLAVWDEVDRKDLTHRLTDYLLVLRCVDRVLGTTGTIRLTEIADELAGDVLDGDPVAQALLHAVANPATEPSVLGKHSMGDFLALLTAQADHLRLTGPTWPRTAKVMSEHLRRVAPALAAHGLHVEFRRTSAARLVTIIKMPARELGHGDASGDVRPPG